MLIEASDGDRASPEAAEGEGDKAKAAKLILLKLDAPERCVGRRCSPPLDASFVAAV